MKGWIERL